MYLSPMKFLFLSATFMLVCAVNAYSYELVIGAKYKLRSDFAGFYIEKEGTADTKSAYFAGGGSKFYIYAKDEVNDKRDGYIIKFKKIKSLQEGAQTEANKASEKEFYIFYTEKDKDTAEYSILDEHRLRQSFAIEHGFLVVPLKYRTKDGSLTGESSIGYYIGTKLEFLIFNTTFLISVGLPRIAVTDVNQDVEHRTGVTAAVGAVLTNKKNFQVAIVGGIDHLGGSAGEEWEFEDDPWVSFAIGYNFATPEKPH